MWPPKIPPCPKLIRELFQALIDRINAAWPMDGLGIRVSDAGGGGRSINLVGSRAGAGGAAGERCYLGVSASAGRLLVSLGTIQGVIPAGMNADGLLVQPAGGQGNVYGVTNFVSAGGIISVQSVQVVASVSLLASEPLKWREPMATYHTDDSGNLRVATLCGNIAISTCDLPD